MGHVEVVQAIIDLGRDGRYTAKKMEVPIDYRLDNPLHGAAQFGKAQVVTCLLENGAFHELTVGDKTPLHFLAQLPTNEPRYADFLACIKVFIDKKQITRSLNGEGQSVLHIAVLSKNEEVALLFADADPALLEITNKKGKTAAVLAHEAGLVQLSVALAEKELKWLLAEAFLKPTPSVNKRIQNSINILTNEKINQLILLGASINTTAYVSHPLGQKVRAELSLVWLYFHRMKDNSSRWQSDCLFTIEFLISKNINLNTEWNRQYPLDVAVSRKYPEALINLLVQAGALRFPMPQQFGYEMPHHYDTFVPSWSGRIKANAKAKASARPQTVSLSEPIFEAKPKGHSNNGLAGLLAAPPAKPKGQCVDDLPMTPAAKPGYSNNGYSNVGGLDVLIPAASPHPKQTLNVQANSTATVTLAVQPAAPLALPPISPYDTCVEALPYLPPPAQALVDQVNIARLDMFEAALQQLQRDFGQMENSHQYFKAALKHLAVKVNQEANKAVEKVMKGVQAIVEGQIKFNQPLGVACENYLATPAGQSMINKIYVERNKLLNQQLEKLDRVVSKMQGQHDAMYNFMRVQIAREEELKNLSQPPALKAFHASFWSKFSNKLLSFTLLYGEVLAKNDGWKQKLVGFLRSGADSIPVPGAALLGSLFELVLTELLDRHTAGQIDRVSSLVPNPHVALELGELIPLRIAQHCANVFDFQSASVQLAEKEGIVVAKRVFKLLLSPQIVASANHDSLINTLCRLLETNGINLPIKLVAPQAAGVVSGTVIQILQNQIRIQDQLDAMHQKPRDLMDSNTRSDPTPQAKVS
ncbi:MAG: ankyrin repeat domain-containing protein [Parachlamydia sp.]|nr:ankyrin repeat domain-containing protein [Parachlamydia sp.]